MRKLIEPPTANRAEPEHIVSSRLGVAVSNTTIKKYIRQYVRHISETHERRRSIITGTKALTTIKIRFNKGFVSRISIILNSLIVNLLRDAIISSVVRYKTRVTFTSVIDALRLNEILQRFAGLDRRDVMGLYIPFTELEKHMRAELEETSPGEFKNGLLFGVNFGKTIISRCGHPPFTDIPDIVESIREKKINKLPKPPEAVSQALPNISIAKGVNYALNYIAKKIIDNLMFKLFIVANSQRGSVIFGPPMVMRVVNDIIAEVSDMYLNTLAFEIESRLPEWYISSFSNTQID